MAELKTILLKSMEKRFQIECNEILGRLDHIRFLLNRMAEAGSLTLPITVMGMEIHHREYERDLDLLEKCGLARSRVKFTEHNSYRVYVMTDEGATLLQDLS